MNGDRNQPSSGCGQRQGFPLDLLPGKSSPMTGLSNNRAKSGALFDQERLTRLPRSSPRANAVCLRDVRTLMLLTAGATLASIVPQRCDALVARRLPSLLEKFRAGEIRKLGQAIARVLPRECRPGDPYSIARDHCVMRLEDMWGRSRGLSFRGWHPEITIEGLDHVRAALSRGRGAILWSMCQGRSKIGPLRRSKSRPVGEGLAVFVGRLERSLRSPFRAAQA